MKRKIIVLILGLMASMMAFSQAPSNDCAESPIIINACGTNFSVTQAQMSTATNDSGCNAGGGCPIPYVNGTGYSNFDCDPTNAPSSSNGDDWDGSVENSMFWQFTSTVSCDYTVSITATNCCCKDKGSTNAAQFQIYRTSGSLPAGTINQYYGGSNNFTGTQTLTISVIAGQPVLIALDGVNGTDCDIAVSVIPSAGCSGCVILLSKDEIEEQKSNEALKAKERIEKLIYYDIYGRIVDEKNLPFGIIFKYTKLVTGEERIEKLFN